MRISYKRNKLPIKFQRYAFFFVFIIQILPLSGQDPISDSLIAERLQDIHKLLDQDRIKAQRWWYGWLAGYSVATVGQGIVYFSSENKSTKQDMVLGSATTFLGAIGQLLTPIVPRSSSVGDSQIAQSVSPEQSKELYNSEELLRELALREKEGRSWKVHAVTGAVNIGSGLVTWLGFKRSFWDGVGNFALNTVITEAQIWTQPTRAIKDYKNYCRKYNSGSPQNVLKPEKEWLVRVYPGGIGIQLNF
jgi:hypothetical protein